MDVYVSSETFHSGQIEWSLEFQNGKQVSIQGKQKSIGKQCLVCFHVEAQRFTDEHPRLGVACIHIHTHVDMYMCVGSKINSII